jgi:hypothetical protein
MNEAQTQAREREHKIRAELYNAATAYGEMMRAETHYYDTTMKAADRLEAAAAAYAEVAGDRQPAVSKTPEPSTLASATGYEATLRTIKDAPLTWLGGILACCVEECVRRKFFRDTDAISRFVNRVLEKGKPHNS